MSAKFGVRAGPRRHAPPPPGGPRLTPIHGGLAVDPAQQAPPPGDRPAPRTVPPGAPAAKPGAVRRPTWTLIAVAPSLSAGVRRFELRRWYLRGAVAALVTLLVAAGGGGYALGERGDAEQLEAAYGMLTDADVTAAALGDTLRALRIAAALAPATGTAAPPAANADPTRSVARVVLPVPGGRVSSSFARVRRHPILGIWRSHDGLDISAPTGTPIRAPAGGRVVRVARQLGYGLVVEVSHGGGVLTRYAHCNAARVSVGQRVAAGAVIATVGSTGLASGPHLHYEVLVRGRRVNPARYPIPPGR